MIFINKKFDAVNRQLLEDAIKDSLVRDINNFESSSDVISHIYNQCFAYCCTENYTIAPNHLARLIVDLGFTSARTSNVRGYRVRLINRIDYSKPIAEQPTNHLVFPDTDNEAALLNIAKTLGLKDISALGGFCVFKKHLIKRTIPAELVKDYSKEWMKRWRAELSEYKHLPFRPAQNINTHMLAMKAAERYVNRIKNKAKNNKAYKFLLNM